MSAFTDKVAAQCLVEWNRFNKGKGRETDDPFCQFVGEYWSKGLGNNSIDGRTVFLNNKGKPFRPAWSAAFVSFVMKTSGAKKDFLYSEAHIHYAVQAIRDANAAAPKAKFLGRDPTKYAPKVGDIITAGRADSASVTFANVLAKYGKNPVPKGNFMASHSDIVVAVDKAKKELTTIGGNVAVDTVDTKTWKLKADGTLSKGASLICVIECLL